VCLPWLESDSGNELTADDKVMVSGWGKVTNVESEFRESYERYGAASRTLQVKLCFAGMNTILRCNFSVESAIYFCRSNSLLQVKFTLCFTAFLIELKSAG
jgi:hypothetical protein